MASISLSGTPYESGTSTSSSTSQPVADISVSGSPYVSGGSSNTNNFFSSLQTTMNTNLTTLQTQFKQSQEALSNISFTSGASSTSQASGSSSNVSLPYQLPRTTANRSGGSSSIPYFPQYYDPYFETKPDNTMRNIVYGGLGLGLVYVIYKRGQQ